MTYFLRLNYWLRALTTVEQVLLITAFVGFAICALYITIEDHDVLFILAEAVHFIGIGVLAFKLIKERSCGGLSLKSQELTAAFLVIRL